MSSSPSYLGSTSTAGLWLCGDHNNTIVDRFVVKDVWFTERPEQWTRARWWVGDVNDILRRVPREAHIMTRLNEARSENILQMRSWVIRQHQLMYRVSARFP